MSARGISPFHILFLISKQNWYIFRALFLKFCLGTTVKKSKKKPTSLLISKNRNEGLTFLFKLLSKDFLPSPLYFLPKIKPFPLEENQAFPPFSLLSLPFPFPFTFPFPSILPHLIFFPNQLDISPHPGGGEYSSLYTPANFHPRILKSLINIILYTPLY